MGDLEKGREREGFQLIASQQKADRCVATTWKHNVQTPNPREG